MVVLADPLHSGEARGSYSGVTHCTTRGVRYARSRVTPKTEFSDKQKEIRAFTKWAITHWQGLSQAQRNAWNAYANAHPVLDWTGREKRLSGYAWFIRNTVLGQRLEGNYYATPPTILPPPPPENVGSYNDAGTVRITWTPYNIIEPYHIYLEIYKWRGDSPGATPHKANAKYLTYTGAHWGTTQDAGTTAGRNAYWVRFYDSDTNLASGWATTYTDI